MKRALPIMAFVFCIYLAYASQPVSASAFTKIVTYVTAQGYTLQQMQEMSLTDLKEAVGLTDHDLRGKGKLRAKLVSWYKAQLRAQKVAAFQTAVRKIPQCANAVVEDVDAEANIVRVHIDGVQL